MAIDFDALRVDELFKDETRTELREGITTRDINSVVGMTPPGRNDLHEVLQNAYKLIYNNAHDAMNKSLSASLQSPLIKNSSQNSQSQSYDFVPPKKTLAEQMAENQQKGTTESTATTKPSEPLKFGTGIATPLGTNLIEALETQIKEKEEIIQSLKKERDEAINQQYELEKHHSNKYKELNEKYENLKVSYDNKENIKTPSVVEDISDDLLDYLKDRLIRMEQKNDLLNQEIGKLKGMLGM